MSVDFGMPAIEIAIALSFVFFLLSLIATRLNEWIAGIFKLRAKNLEAGIEGMLGDDGIAQGVLEHPLVRADLKKRDRRIGRGKKKERKPSYVSPQDFALAFLDVVSRKSNASDGDAVKAVRAEAQTDSDLGLQLRALLGEEDPTVTRLRLTVEKWFDDSMERVSGWYTRRLQWITLGLAVVITVGLNASTVRIADRLADEPAVRAAVVAKAEAAQESGEEAGQTEDQVKEGKTLKPAGEGVESAYSDLAALQLPILWADENSPFDTWPTFWTTLAGWLITILAISLGAPFWFDALGKLSNLRAAGGKPEKKK